MPTAIAAAHTAPDGKPNGKLSIDDVGTIRDESGDYAIAMGGMDRWTPRAAYVVRALTAHEALVDAAQMALELRRAGHRDDSAFVADVMDCLRAALALARGES